MRIKIYGAGSIGNHLANAARQLGWDVVVCDINNDALSRMKNQIYPTRYGQWDPAIQQYSTADAPVGDFDLIHIGTPPEFHLPLALEALDEKPRAILIEKPLSPPSLHLAQEFYQKCTAVDTKVFVGYDHVVGKAAIHAEELIRTGAIGEVQTLDVEFREHWGGIFAAHPWLSGPDDSYLGYWEKGGGASGEHSHALNLWQHFAHVAGAGRVVDVQAMLRYTTVGKGSYDDLCLVDLRTERGLIGRVVQDVLTVPHRKRAQIHGTKGTVEWINNRDASGDAVICRRVGQTEEVYPVPKKRPDDFMQELRHIQEQLEGSAHSSGIALERGLDTMLLIAAAHASERQQRRIHIDYNKGYTVDALTTEGNI